MALKVKCPMCSRVIRLLFASPVYEVQCPECDACFYFTVPVWRTGTGMHDSSTEQFECEYGGKTNTKEMNKW